jgi:hypothetical protein
MHKGLKSIETNLFHNVFFLTKAEKVVELLVLHFQFMQFYNLSQEMLSSAVQTEGFKRMYNGSRSI